ncbi:winged helix-turn-helix transcriptional regulator [Chitinophaga solisilvae]|nr:helix-turn-helix domain-containing protein [Chitinophaga solisilvae]
MLDCGLSVAVKVVGGKWKAWIMDCIRRGIKRPSALQRELAEVNPRIVSMQLKELEDLGIIRKEIYAEIPARVEYSFTPTGESLLPVLDVLEKWGTDNREEVLKNTLELSEN